MRRLKRGVLLLGVLWSAFAPLAVIGVTAFERVSAEDAVCKSGTIIAFGRRRWCGYFKNERNTSGQSVRNGGVPGYVNKAEEFITLMKNDLNSSDAHRKTSAQFVILTMIGRAAGQPQSVSSAQLADWESRVRSYASTSENGNQSFGPNGRIDWFVSQHMNCSSPQNINTYYQVPENDVAPYLNTPSNSDCEVSWLMESFVVFRDTSGKAVYTIRRECMNPMGNLQQLKESTPDYDLTPAITPSVNGGPLSGAAESGDTVQFTYNVTNNGDDTSPSANCTIYGNVHVGYFPTPSPPTASSSGGYSPPATGCPRTFNAHSNVTLTTETIIVSGNQTVCRSLFVSPASATVASRGTEVCVPVGSKPYVRVYGGDVSAGNGLAVSGTCTENQNAAVVGWNKRVTGSYAGAATQYAIYALAAINDFASTLGNGGGSAPTPDGLSFANTGTNPAAGAFGGSFGTLPCIPDYFAEKPSVVQPLPGSVAAIPGSGDYAASGSVSLGGGPISPGERVNVYVDGDLYINGDIFYAGSYSSGNVPSVRFVVRGNIYIDNGVSQLAGVYIAQADGGNGGQIHTCATSAAALPLDGNLFTTCNKRLTINGSFTANRVLLLRTIGSLSQSSANETSGSSTAAEVFNYSPALWMTQKPADGSSGYEAIISLPPIL